MHPVVRTRQRLICPLITAIIGMCLQSAEAQQAAPSPRWGHVFVFHPGADTVLLFGGASERGAAYLGDTWTWDGSTWTRHEVTGPSPRGFAAAAYDTVREAIVVHGGRDSENETLSDTWQWDGDEWSELRAGADFAADHHEMVYDDADERLLAFGGWNSALRNVQGETWVLSSDSWEQVAVGNGGPPPRAAFGMTWDPARRSVILYGGLWVDGQYADVWEFTDGGWRSIGDPYGRSSLDHHDLFFDALSQRTMLFGGKNYRSVMQRRTRALDGDDWVVVADSGPSPRHSFGVTRDTRRNQILLFGGKWYDGDEQLPLGDLWLFDEEWRRIPDEIPSP